MPLQSKEAKALGIKMGVPVFKIKQLIRQHKIRVFSSNYPLYADMSSRVMSTLEALAPRVEVYSIDESFLDLSGLEKLYNLASYGQQIKAKVDKDTGIQVCVGVTGTGWQCLATAGISAEGKRTFR